MAAEYTKENENIYYQARKAAAQYNERLSSREGASELLGLSSSQLAKYELSITKSVPPDAVVMMSDLYNAPELKAHYCAYECPIGKGAPIATEVNSIELVTVRMMKALSRGSVPDAMNVLLDIASDGKITNDEKPALAEVVLYLENLAKTIGELRLISEKVLGATK